MSSGPNSGISNGTSGAQNSIEQMNSEAVASNNEEAIKRLNHLVNELPKGSPIHIPSNATIKEEHKNGYDQVKYIWNDENYTFTSRWHTKTPNAPDYQGNSWVVQRDKCGIGFGKNAHPSEHEILIGTNKWVPLKEWNKAVQARKKGTATEQQKEMLDNGHWKD